MSVRVFPDGHNRRKKISQMNLIATEHSIVDGLSFIFFFSLFMGFFSFIG